ncbi:MAG: hypothetical protein IPQ15_04650 [Betaproteobacteria bacterium]|nr:hypothetical protein [Betaproteobacteria bacterium]
MPLAAPLRPFALLLFAMLCPGLAHALSETYEGVLLPDNLEGPIPIVVELRDVGSILTGNVKAAFPLNGSASIASGENKDGQCNMKVVLNSAVTLRLYGSCQPSMFAGKYTIYYTQRNTEARGSFRLARKAPGQVKKNTPGAPVSTTTIVACQKANVHCLTACPRGDPDAEFLCANHCRSKLNACKRGVAKQPAAP